MCVCVKERVSVAESLQQIAVGPNKRCTVEPHGSTDSFLQVPQRAAMENSGPVYTSQGKHGSPYRVSNRFS